MSTPEAPHTRARGTPTSTSSRPPEAVAGMVLAALLHGGALYLFGPALFDAARTSGSLPEIPLLVGEASKRLRAAPWTLLPAVLVYAGCGLLLDRWIRSAYARRMIVATIIVAGLAFIVVSMLAPLYGLAGARPT